MKLLRDGPFKTGRLYLTEANRLIDNPRALRQVRRTAAQEQFYQAHSLATEPIDQATVEMHIAIATILLGEPEDSRHWLAQAYSKAVLKARGLAEETGDAKVVKGQRHHPGGNRLPHPRSQRHVPPRVKKVMRTALERAGAGRFPRRAAARR